MARISIVMAVYNGEPYVRFTLESLLSQTHRDFELIVVDDGSTDGTAAIVRGLNDPRVTLLQPGRLANQSACLNLGVAHASGDWIAHNDADDPAHPRRLEIMNRALDAHPEFGAIASDGIPILDAQVPTWPELGADTTRPAVEDVTRQLAFYNPLFKSGLFVRRDAFDQVGGYDPERKMSIDYWFYAQLARAGWPLGLVRLPLQAKRLHPGQTYENKRRWQYLKESLRVQFWIGREVFAMPSWVLAGPLAGRLVYGTFPQRWRARLRPLIQRPLG